MRYPLGLTLLVTLAGAALDAAPTPLRKPRRVPPPPAVQLDQPNGLALDRDGNLYITDLGTHRLLKLAPTGRLSVLAGTGAGGFSGDRIPAAKARLYAPHDVAVDASGNLFVADTYNHRIRRMDQRGVITTVAGSGKGGYSGDGGPALEASLNNPQGLAFARDGSLLIADTYNHVVRRVDPQGKITTFAGSDPGLAGDGGPALRAQLSLPTAVAVGSDGRVTISDSGNNRLRRVDPAGVIATLLGTGPGSGTAGAGFGGDGGPAEKAKIFAAADVEEDAAGNLLFADSGNHRIRRISQGVIDTWAGSGIGAFAGDSGKARDAALNSPQKLALGLDGSLYIADRANHRIRKVDPSGRIETICGSAPLK